MEETHASPKMAEIDLINNLEKTSSVLPNRILQLKDYILKTSKELDLTKFKINNI